MNRPYIIALDQGTSGCRAVAVDPDGNVRAQERNVFSPTRPAKGYSQYQATDLLNAQRAVLDALLEKVGPERVGAIGVCSQRSTVVLWDKTTGQAVAPVLTWEDGRAQEESAHAPLTQAQVHAQTGLFNTPYFSAPKIAWCLKHQPAAAKAAKEGKLLAAPVASYLIWHLTQGAVFAADPTLAQRTLLWDLKTGQWSEELCRAFGVPVTCLPPIRPSGADYGHYLYKGVKIPLCACVADQQAAAYYEGLRAGKTLLNYGTGAFVLHHTGENLTVLPGMLSSVAACAGPGQKQFLLEGPIFAAGSVFEWLRQVKGLCFGREQIDTLCSQAHNPVHLLPALGGLGAPYWDYTVGPVAEKVTPHTTAADWVAGAVHAIAGRVADILYYLQANGQNTEEPLHVSGGLSNVHYLLQYQADLVCRTLQVHTQTESTVLGTAYLAAREKMSCGRQREPVNCEIVSPRQSILQAQQTYEAWQEFVKKCRKQPSKILL